MRAPLNRTATISRAEVLLLAGGASISTVLVNWPVARAVASRIPGNLVDPLLQSWQVAWGGHALKNDLLHYFDANIFWPVRDALAFSDALIGYVPAGLVGTGPTSALVRYNLLFLFSYALASAGAYLLVRELGARPVAATCAGIAFAYSPWRLSQDDHLHVLSSGGIPLSLFLLIRGYRRRSFPSVLLGWVVVTWQISLGFSLGLQFAYLLALLALLAFVVWTLQGRPKLPRPMVAATIAGVVILGAWTAVQAAPYLRVVEEHPEARRTFNEVSFFSPPKRGFLAASEKSYLWGSITASARRSLPWPQDQMLFPGIVTPALALIGAATATYRRMLRVGLVVGILVTSTLALGVHLFGGRLTYRVLYDYAPGWQAIRTPGRLMTMTTLFLAVLAAGGAQWILERVECRGVRTTLRVSVMSLLVGAVLLDGAGRVRTVPVPAPPPEFAQLPDPQLHLPFLVDPLYMIWSTDGFPRMVNGYSGFTPQSHNELLEISTSFPDPASVSRFRSLGVKTVVLHVTLARGTAWEGVMNRAIDDPLIKRRSIGDLIVFELTQPS